jgi:CHY zinc finger
VELTIAGIPVRGIELDAHTDCAHYRSKLDIIAIKFNCCRTYYACFYCHELAAGHPARIWPQAEFDEKAVLCGACDRIDYPSVPELPGGLPGVPGALQSALRAASPLVLRHLRRSQLTASEIPTSGRAKVTAVERKERGAKSAVIVARLVRGQLRAIGCERFDLGIRRDEGEMILKEEQGLSRLKRRSNGSATRTPRAPIFTSGPQASTL